MPLSQFTAIIFDFDGTLSNSALDYAHMRHAGFTALQAYGDVSEYADLLIMEAVAAVCRNLTPAKAQEAQDATMAALKKVEIEAAQMSTPFHFTRPMLQSLAQRGIATAILTRNCPEAVMTVLPDVHSLCQSVITREDIHADKVKPHPEHLFMVLRQLACAPEKALMVGDHPMDVLVGKRAGTKTAAVLSGESAQTAFAAEQPDWLAKDCADLMQQLGLTYN